MKRLPEHLSERWLRSAERILVFLELIGAIGLVVCVVAGALDGLSGDGRAGYTLCASLCVFLVVGLVCLLSVRLIDHIAATLHHPLPPHHKS